VGPCVSTSTTSAGIALRSAPGRPVAGGVALGNAPLDVVGEPAAGVLEVARDLALRLALVHVEQRAEGTAPQAAARRRALRPGAAWGGRDVTGELAGTGGIGHGIFSIASGR